MGRAQFGRNRTSRSPTRTGLSPTQGVALRSLLQGSTITDAAQAAGVRRATVSGWLHASNGNTTFRDELERQQKELRAAVRGRLEAAAGDAVGVLHTLLKEGNERTRLMAARTVLQFAADLTAKPEPRKRGQLPDPSNLDPARREQLEGFRKLPAGDRETIRSLLGTLERAARAVSDESAA